MVAAGHAQPGARTSGVYTGLVGSAQALDERVLIGRKRELAYLILSMNADARGGTMSQTEALPRCGDHVVYHPTGEMWLIAFSEGEVLVPAGLPIRMARVVDCEVVFRCSDHDHDRLVKVWSYAKGDIRGPIIARLYGKEKVAGPVILPSAKKSASGATRRRRSANGAQTANP